MASFHQNEKGHNLNENQGAGKVYTSGAFAKKAHVTLRTIRWYDKAGLLHPSGHTESGARLYTDADFGKLQQILLFKYLGFSLEDIREMTIESESRQRLLQSLDMQSRLIAERIEQMQAVEAAIGKTKETLEKSGDIDWDSCLQLIHMTGMEHSLKVQYQNATNIQARIRLHRDYSVNQQGWFPWILEQVKIQDGMRILEAGCGSGALWKENMASLPEDLHVTCTDISEGMVHELKRDLGKDPRFDFAVADLQDLPYPDDSFDLVIANHVLFYCSDVDRAIAESRRVLRPGGVFLCSTYGKNHMKEITELVQEYNSDIVLSADRLYEKFGLENGEELLRKHYETVTCRRYEDEIRISDPDPLIAYILSCHGNQNSFLLDAYKDFHDFVEKKVSHGFHITKDAGVFVCTKEEKEKNQERKKQT